MKNRLSSFVVGVLVTICALLLMQITRLAGATSMREQLNLRVVGVVVVDEHGNEYSIPLQIELPSTGTQRTATVTPTMTMTVSLTPTVPATPTATPTASATASQITPTQEQTVFTSTPSEKVCMVKLRYNIWEREAPSRTAAPTRTQPNPIPYGSPVRILSVVRGGEYLWGQTAFGWIAIKQGTTWWIDLLSGSEEFCPEIPGWPSADLPPAIAQTEFGLWVGPGANLSRVLAFGETLKAAGLRPAATVYGNDQAARILFEHGWTVILRAWNDGRDCPAWSDSPERDAAAWTSQAVLSTLNVPHHWLVLTNECIWPSSSYLREWISAAAEQAKTFRQRAIIPLVWHAGSPELTWIPDVVQAYTQAQVALGWGINVYPVTPNVPLAQYDHNTVWTTWRWQSYRSMLSGIPLIVTEAARGDGSEVASVGDLGRWADMVDGAFASATFWYVALEPGLGHWQRANLANLLADLASAIVEQLR